MSVAVLRLLKIETPLSAINGERPFRSVGELRHFENHWGGQPSRFRLSRQVSLTPTRVREARVA
jgi:hypothetical protein